MLTAYAQIPLDDATRAAELLEQASRQLMRNGGMLNRDMAWELTLAATALRRAMDNEADAGPGRRAGDKKAA